MPRKNVVGVPMRKKESVKRKMGIEKIKEIR